MEGGFLIIEEEISSSQNPLAKRVLHLQKSRGRKEEMFFLIEGYKELCLALDSALSIETLLFCPAFFPDKENDVKKLLERLAKTGTKLVPCKESLFPKLSYRDRPDGLLGIAQSRFFSLDDLSVSSEAFYLIAEGLEKPGNLGAILRSADAAGVTGVIVADECVDIYNPNVIRSSVGALFSIPVVSAKNAEILTWLKKNQITVVSATPEATKVFTDCDLKGKCAFVVGSEHEGLTSFWKKNADLLVKIPMVGSVDSLNVAITATLLLFEAQRQRSHG